MRSRVRREVSSGGIVFRRLADGHKYLLIRDGHGNWGFPKGHREAGEPSEATARREIHEETGLAELSCHAALGELKWTFRSGRTLVRKRCEYFLFESVSGNPRPQRAEGITRCEWFPYADAVRHLTFPDAVRLLEGADPIIDRLSPCGPADSPR
jgi:8-oxo-dGTP pyrophosphatase MutT (NUDIX family)